MDNFQSDLTNRILKFRESRDWQQFHTGKDIAMCLSIEANEILELFLWKKETEIQTEALKDEIGDVLYALLLLADHFDIDITKAFLEKMEKNEKKYPVENFLGSNRKYNE